MNRAARRRLARSAGYRRAKGKDGRRSGTRIPFGKQYPLEVSGPIEPGTPFAHLEAAGFIVADTDVNRVISGLAR